MFTISKSMNTYNQDPLILQKLLKEEFIIINLIAL